MLINYSIFDQSDFLAQLVKGIRYFESVVINKDSVSLEAATFTGEYAS